VSERALISETVYRITEALGRKAFSDRAAEHIARRPGHRPSIGRARSIPFPKPLLSTALYRPNDSLRAGRLGGSRRRRWEHASRRKVTLSLCRDADAPKPRARRGRYGAHHGRHAHFSLLCIRCRKNSRNILAAARRDGAEGVGVEPLISSDGCSHSSN